MKHQKRNFTLIELLVVIAIIAILAGMLLPALSSVQESGRTAKCMSNKKQQGIAVHMFVNDNKGFLPSSSNTSLAWFTVQGKSLSAPPWIVAMVNYTKLPITNYSNNHNWKSVPGNILQCPSDASSRKDAMDTAWHKKGPNHVTSYICNYYTTDMWNSDQYMKLVTKIRHPGKYIFSMDAHNYTLNAGFSGNAWPFTASATPGTNSPGFRHNKAANCLFMDLSVQSRKLSSVAGTGNENLYTTKPW